MLPYKHKFPNPDAFDLGEMMGIPMERRQVISDGLNQMVNDLGTKLQAVTFAVIIPKIEDLCDTQEEFTWAMALHINWHYKTGRLLISREGMDYAAVTAAAYSEAISKHNKP